jgi:uncharacterized membrane protein YgdD (TMEM256/DUF423 family)
MNVNKIIYWISTTIFCGIILFSATMYFTKYDMVKGFFPVLCAGTPELNLEVKNFGYLYLLFIF